MRQANKKFQKKTHVERVKNRALEKNKTLQNIRDWRKDGKKRDRDEELENILDGKGFEKKQRIDEGGGMPRKEKKEDSRASTRSSRAKRAANDKKFGFGGKKRHAKSNTRESTH